MTRIVFWQNMISPHQSAFLKILAEDPLFEVYLYVEKTITPERVKMGWSIPELGDTHVFVSPSKQQIQEAVLMDNQTTVHVFSGTRGYPMVWSAFKCAINQGCQIGVMSESGDWVGFKGWIRLLRSKIDAFWYRDKIKFILAIGSHGREWFLKSNFKSDIIFDWAYFINVSGDKEYQKEDSVFRLIFVGELLRNKGVHLLLQSLQKIKIPYRLKIVGEGKELERLKKLSFNLGMGNRIEWVNFIPNNKLINEIAQSDLLVLPSTGKDGWGVVVNEALLSGVPVVVSSFCGSSVLIQHSFLGEVVPAGDEEELFRRLSKRILSGKLSPNDREQILNWSKCLQVNSASFYFKAILKKTVFNANDVEPRAPWLT